jgi:endonuclease-3
MAKSTKPKPRKSAPKTALRKPADRMAARAPKAAKRDSKTASPSPSSGLREQVKLILRGLAKAYPDATCALKHHSAYQLIAATILSAQCTDERVNMVTPTLFAKYPDVRALAGATQSDVEEIIRSTGFFRAKATSLRGMAQGVVERFGGEIPKSLDDLITLPGVGRKTANVVLGTVWGIATGVVVDTHVKRISYLLGLTKSTSPEQIERDLMSIIPQSEWVNFSHRLIHHGRRICIARRPKCPECPLLSCCKRVGLPPLN